MPTLFRCPECDAVLSVAAFDAEKPPVEPPRPEHPIPPVIGGGPIVPPEPPIDPEPPGGGGGPGPEPAADNLILVTNRANAATRYAMAFARLFAPGEIRHWPQLTVEDRETLAQVNILSRWPDASVKHARFAVVLDFAAPGDTLALGFRDMPEPPALRRHRPPRRRELLEDYDFDAIVEFAADGETHRVSARDMLEAGAWQAIYPGSVAETVLLADDSAAREYDVGFAAQHGDARPLRPRFYATFWQQTREVELRVVVESSLASELADSAYVATVTLGHADPQEAYRLDLAGQKRHWTMTAWTKRFRLGEPAPPVDIDWGIEYLTRTGAVPQFDVTLDVAATLPSRAAGEPYDGQWNTAGIVQNAMGVGGARPEIAPFPQWQVQALYPKADVAIREYMLAIGDQAASFPCHLRETVSGKRLSRDDPPGNSGFGRALSITDRPTICLSVPTYGYTKPEDRVVFVGGSQPRPGPWTFDGALRGRPFRGRAREKG